MAGYCEPTPLCVIVDDLITDDTLIADVISYAEYLRSLGVISVTVGHDLTAALLGPAPTPDEVK